MDEIKVFPIIITRSKDSKADYPYLVDIPDLNGLTEAKDIADAMEMARDYIGTYALEDKLPESNIKLPSTKPGEITTLVSVNVSEYKRKNDNRVVRKTLTIPNYLNELGIEKQINFSAVLTDALKEKLEV